MRNLGLVDINRINDFCKPETASREKVIEIERKIRSFFKNYDEDFVNFKPITEESKRQLATLFYQRQWVLDALFEGTPENLERLQKVSNHLKFLSAKMFERVRSMKEKANIICDDVDFDDDYEIEGTLSFNYNGEESVLKLPDDDFYGSDFRLMINALTEFYHQTCCSDCIFDIGPGSENLDEKLNWNIAPLNFPELDICYAAHCICDHHDYSIPDLIRMNDFWTEIKFIEQSITDQNGNRLGKLSPENPV